MRHVPFDCIALYKLGDFYEAFGDDAALLTKVCGLTVSYRDREALAGFPSKSRRVYLTKILAAGKRVMLVSEVCCPY